MTACANWWRRSARSSSNTDGRSASWSICRVRSCGSATSPSGPVTLAKGETFTLDSDPAPGDATRVHLPHPEIIAAIKPGHALLLDDGKVRLDRDRGRRQPHRHPRRGRRQTVGPQGREPARHDGAVLGAGAQGPLRSRGRARRQCRLDRAVLHPAARRHRRGQEDHARPRLGDGEDRKAAGGAPARRHPRPHRRADGGARRSRRRDAARKGAGHPEDR